MIVMGGSYPNTTTCDVQNIQAQHNLDLGQQNSDGAMWHAFEPNITSYKIPTGVIAAIGGG